jgi:hypothetical protein
MRTRGVAIRLVCMEARHVGREDVELSLERPYIGRRESAFTYKARLPRKLHMEEGNCNDWRPRGKPSFTAININFIFRPCTLA